MSSGELEDNISESVSRSTEDSYPKSMSGGSLQDSALIQTQLFRNGSSTVSFSEPELKAGLERRGSMAGLEFTIRREGWLIKNHHGGPFANNQKRRWFLSDGFHVEYFKDEARTKRKGRFDLRNVVGLAASTEATRGLDIKLSESKSGEPTKTITVSFESVGQAEAKGWSTLWASAVKAAHLHESVRHLRSERLAHHLDQTCWGQGACISSVRQELQLITPTGLILTPRSPDFTPTRMETMRRKHAADEAELLTSSPIAAIQDRASSRAPPPANPADAAWLAWADADGALPQTPHTPGDGDGGIGVDPLASFRSDASSGSRTGSPPVLPLVSRSHSAGSTGSMSTLLGLGRSSSGLGMGRSGSIRHSFRLSYRGGNQAHMNAINEASNGDAAARLPPAIPFPSGTTSPSFAVPGASGIPHGMLPHGTPPLPSTPRVSASRSSSTPPSNPSSHRRSSDPPDPAEIGWASEGSAAERDLQAAILAADTEQFSDMLSRTNSDLSRLVASISDEADDMAADGEAGAGYTDNYTGGASASSASASTCTSASSLGRASTRVVSSRRSSLGASTAEHQRVSMALLQMGGASGRAASSTNLVFDEEEQQRALRRYSRPRMGSSTTLAIPFIERRAVELGAGRLRVSVPDGLEVGEELLALTPDGRRQLIQLPGGAGSEGAGRHIVFFTDLPKVLWQPKQAA